MYPWATPLRLEIAANVFEPCATKFRGYFGHLNAHVNATAGFWEGVWDGDWGMRANYLTG